MSAPQPITETLEPQLGRDKESAAPEPHELRVGEGDPQMKMEMLIPEGIVGGGKDVP